MKATFATLALAGAAAAAPHVGHAAFHKKDGIADMVSSVMDNVNELISDSVSVLSKMGAMAAVNSLTATPDSWIGATTTGNAVTNTVVNNAGKDGYWMCWGAGASWVNVKAPTLAVKVPAGQNVTVSHAKPQDGSSNTGACGMAFADTKLVNGQLSQSWMEFTFGSGQWSSSTYDLSMEVNMNGHNMTIAGDKCTSDLTRCSFHCVNGADSCMDAGSYDLINCAKGSQEGANIGSYAGAVSGGCQGIENTGITKLVTTLH